MLQERLGLILGEIKSVLSQVDENEITTLLNATVDAKRVVTAGAGRVGLTTKGFAMRLGHLGMQAYAWGDMTVPGIGNGDLLLVASSSGETPTIAHVAEIAKRSGARVALLTANADSRMGKLADIVVTIPTPAKSVSHRTSSAQPMKTLAEQCFAIFFDAMVLMLMEKLNENEKAMWDRHSQLE